MNQFNKNYSGGEVLVPGRIAEAFRKRFSGEDPIHDPTDDVRAVRSPSKETYVVQCLPIDSRQPDFNGHTLSGVVPTLEALEKGVAYLARTIPPEIRALRTQCDGKEIFAIFAKYDF